ncbi:hypothetical protein CCH79_00015570, partial [Gambusia affinis]
MFGFSSRSRKTSFLPGSKKSDSKGKIIPVAKFPDHYHQLSLDENRGFSQEYESLADAGTNQTQKAATLPENRRKNRFTNILPCESVVFLLVFLWHFIIFKNVFILLPDDWSRVKLNASTPNNTLDYINANYLPGYSSSREYIACQGPLPNTVDDFWRMVWEQKVKRIVMVTNCVEAGRTKCEQYWPEDRSPSTHGELIVSKTSEERESNWVLREFKVKHTKDAEERTVKHFHFTAWPDHGVPQGTEVLIRFRGLVRKHIESEESKAPTVVHCRYTPVYPVYPINCIAVSWSVTNSSIQGTVEGLFSRATASNGSETVKSPEGKNVTFSNLHPGATYNISLLYETSNEPYLQCSIKIPIIPPSLAPLCSYWGSGYSALIKWAEPDGVWTTAELNINGKNFTLTPNQNRLTVDGLQPAKTYKVSVISKLETKSDPLTSEPSIFFCSTDNRGVIGGSVFGVLLFAVLICVIVFLFLKKPDFIRTVSAAKFPDHFQQLSLDENRGFSQEYEALVPVGTGQTCKAAILPENREKNRFNILPYDWCRVKLNTSAPKETGYINASYIPGYNTSREYIATQGPLPYTVVDFWRMIWEQKVKRVVMVTNHIEAGLTKCAQYWPEDTNQSQYGDVLVSVTSELKEQNWTLRQFTVKQKRSSEERSVRHFHFTVWPDRGVPQGTEVLIHDGVGRTGTFIALDFLLQQLEKQQAVGIKDFLHRMRRHRSHMVQTESQYIFLHQCIMDRLQPPGGQDEHVYENDDM